MFHVFAVAECISFILVWKILFMWIWALFGSCSENLIRGDFVVCMKHVCFLIVIWFIKKLEIEINSLEKNDGWHIGNMEKRWASNNWGWRHVCVNCKVFWEFASYSKCWVCISFIYTLDWLVDSGWKLFGISVDN